MFRDYEPTIQAYKIYRFCDYMRREGIKKMTVRMQADVDVRGIIILYVPSILVDWDSR